MDGEEAARMFSEGFLSLLKRSEIVMISTGAGISAESGVPTFRGTNGLWNRHKAEQLATPEAFFRDPIEVWKWYDWRRQGLRSIQPNEGHYALAELESMVPYFFLFTQNVDDLHRKAGSQRVFELHGNIWRVRCTRDAKSFLLLDAPLKEIPPLCECGAYLRPDVVWFGEPLPEDVIRLAFQVAGRCDVFFSVGTSSLVQPAASLAWLAKENGATVVEINPESTLTTEIADVSFREKSGVFLTQLLQALKNHE